MKTQYYTVMVRPDMQEHLSHKIMRRGSYESFESELFARLINPGATIIDIGANIGHYTLLASHFVGKNGQVISFEPVPSLFQDLTKNVSFLPFKNVTLFQAALGNAEKMISFYIDQKNAGGHSLVIENLREFQQEIKVQLMSLDLLYREGRVQSLPHLIKVDTQGAEGLIVQGACHTIKKARPHVISEFWIEGIMKTGVDPKEVLSFFRSLGYSLFRIEERAKRLVPCSGWFFEDWPRDSQGHIHTNIYLKPDNEDSALLQKLKED